MRHLLYDYVDTSSPTSEFSLICSLSFPLWGVPERWEPCFPTPPSNATQLWFIKQLFEWSAQLLCISRTIYYYLLLFSLLNKTTLAMHRQKFGGSPIAPWKASWRTMYEFVSGKAHKLPEGFKRDFRTQRRSQRQNHRDCMSRITKAFNGELHGAPSFSHLLGHRLVCEYNM